MDDQIDLLKTKIDFIERNLDTLNNRIDHIVEEIQSAHKNLQRLKDAFYKKNEDWGK
jgi:uncharacterized coiled-coil DUF342 family protein